MANKPTKKQLSDAGKALRILSIRTHTRMTTVATNRVLASTHDW
jgi:hypothetical protein